jgi:hypothetical protein
MVSCNPEATRYSLDNITLCEFKGPSENKCPRKREAYRPSEKGSDQVRIDRWLYLAHDDAVSDTVAVGAVAYSGKRLRRTPDDTL